MRQGRTTEAKQKMEAFERINAYFDRIRHYRSLLADDARNVDALIGLGTILARLGMPARAVAPLSPT